MKEKLKSHFLSLGPRRYVIGTVITLILMDLIFVFFLRLGWREHDISRFTLEITLRNQNLALSDLNVDTLNELRQLGNRMVDVFLAILLVNNLFFYFFYLKGRLWAQGYILFYVTTNCLLGVIFAWDNLDLGMTFWVYNVSSIFIYAYLFLGVKFLRDETTNPVSEKKGR